MPADPYRAMYSVHCVPAVAHEASGPSYSIVRLCESLIAHGGRVTLATLDQEGSVVKPFVRAFPEGFGPRRLGRSPTLKRWLGEVARTGDVDVIHNHSLWMMPNVYPAAVARRTRVPLVVSPRGTLSAWAFSSGSVAKRIFWPLLQRSTLEQAACFHATARSEAEDIRARGFRQPIAVIPNGIDIPDASLRQPAQRRTLLYVGRIHPIKGLDMLLDAWARLEGTHRDWDLKIVGPDQGGYLEQLKDQARELGVRRLHFAGPLWGAGKWSEYGRAGLFVLPSRSENFGVAVAEALATGVPAVVSQGAPWQGIVEHECGWWCGISADALAESLDRALARSPQELETMGARGREWMSAQFSWERVGAMMAETYGWIRGGGAAPEWIVS